MASIDLKCPELVLSQFADTGTYAKVNQLISSWVIIRHETHKELFIFPFEGDNQASHLDADGNPDARYSQ